MSIPEDYEWRGRYPDDPGGPKLFLRHFPDEPDFISLLDRVCRELKYVAGDYSVPAWTDIESHPLPEEERLPSAVSIRARIVVRDRDTGATNGGSVEMKATGMPHVRGGSALLLEFARLPFGWVQYYCAEERGVAITIVHLWKAFGQQGTPWEFFPMIRGQWAQSTPGALALFTPFGRVRLMPGSELNARPANALSEEAQVCCWPKVFSVSLDFVLSPGTQAADPLVECGVIFDHMNRYWADSRRALHDSEVQWPPQRNGENGALFALRARYGTFDRQSVSLIFFVDNETGAWGHMPIRRTKYGLSCGEMSAWLEPMAEDIVDSALSFYQEFLHSRRPMCPNYFALLDGPPNRTHVQWNQARPLPPIPGAQSSTSGGGAGALAMGLTQPSSRDPENKDPAFDLFRLALAGDVDAEVELGRLCEFGEGGQERDESAAAKHYKSAADKGHPAGQTNLARFYQHGLGGLGKDLAESARLLVLASAQSYAPAQNMLGVFYTNGWGGIGSDDGEAARLFRLAAERNDPHAQCNLARFYMIGRGVPKDEAAAVRLFQLSAGQGSSRAKYELGLCYKDGLGGLPRNGEKALEFIRQAAEKGDKLAIKHQEEGGCD